MLTLMVPALAVLVVATQTAQPLADGVAALNAGRTDEAVVLLERAAAAQPASRLVLLHLASAQRAARQRDTATRTLETLLRLDPNDTLVLWNLAIIEAESDPGLTTLQKLIALDPAYPNALTALATLRTLQARDAYRVGKRAASVRVEDGEWIADAAARAAVFHAAAVALDKAQVASARARANDMTAPEPVVFLSLTLRMKSEIANDAESAKRLMADADALTRQAAALRRQQGPPPAAPPLDPAGAPPPFPKPGPPPPPPPR
jgi:tetratricopeptide (TPR) repeat protein